MSASTTLEHFLNSSDYKEYAAGQVIFRVGDPDSVMYGVKAGEIEIFFNDRLLETVGPGGILGEKSLVDDYPHTTTAIAKTDCQLVLVDEDKFLFLVHETPTFAIKVMRIMAARTRAVMRAAFPVD